MNCIIVRAPSRIRLVAALRRGVLLFAILFGVSPSLSAAIFLKTSPPVSLTDGLVSYTLSAIGTADEYINVVSVPSIVPNGDSLGLHQVWPPTLGTPTPMRQEHGIALWINSWSSYDSHFFFNSSNSLSIGGSFTETNSRSGGAVLPSLGAGPPITGFGSYGHTGTAAKGFTRASRIPGLNVPFAQLVMRADDSVLVSLRILEGNIGASRDFQHFCVGCPSIVGDLSLGNVTTVAPLLATLPVDSSTEESLLWSLERFVGPAGTITGAIINPSTGQFSWNPAGAVPGAYTALINAQGLERIYVGQLTFNVVPEPASISMLALMMIMGSLSLRRR
jgi:hypothetical protein